MEVVFFWVMGMVCFFEGGLCVWLVLVEWLFGEGFFVRFGVDFDGI